MFADIIKEAVESAKQNNYFLPDENGKVQAFEDAFKDDEVRKKVAYMFSSSHEYDTDEKKIIAAKSAIKFVNNYDWEEKVIPVDCIEGFNKPVDGEKTFSIAKEIEEKNGNDKPLIVVNRIHGFAFQTGGMKDEKVILLDGNGRLSAIKLLNLTTTPVYYGIYNGESEKDVDEIIPGDPGDQQITECIKKESFVIKNLLIEADEVVEKKLLQEASENKIEKVPLTSKEKEELEEKIGIPYEKLGCTVAKNAKNGKYFAYTHRARSKFYDKVTDIPKDTLKFIASTA